MQVFQGYCENGRITLEGHIPSRNGKVIVRFLDDTDYEDADDDDFEVGCMSNEDIEHFFQEFKGCIDRDFDIEQERDEYLNEKYRPFA